MISAANEIGKPEDPAASEFARQAVQDEAGAQATHTGELEARPPNNFSDANEKKLVTLDPVAQVAG